MPIDIKLCKHCGSTYSNVYKVDNRWEYTLSTDFCSKSCSSKARGLVGCLQPDRGRDKLIEQAVSVINANGRYTTSDEIFHEIRCSSKSFTKHDIKVSELNSQQGFSKKGSAFEERVSKILNDMFESVERQKTFNGMVGNTNYPLRVDFYIADKNLVIEADGDQHSDPNHPWYVFKNGTTAEYDSIKETYLARQGISVVRIPYKERLREKDVLEKLNGF